MVLFCWGTSSHSLKIYDLYGQLSVFIGSGAAGVSQQSWPCGGEPTCRRAKLYKLFQLIRCHTLQLLAGVFWNMRRPSLHGPFAARHDSLYNPTGMHFSFGFWILQQQQRSAAHTHRLFLYSFGIKCIQKRTMCILVWNNIKGMKWLHCMSGL